MTRIECCLSVNKTDGYEKPVMFDHESVTLVYPVDENGVPLGVEGEIEALPIVVEAVETMTIGQ